MFVPAHIFADYELLLSQSKGLDLHWLGRSRNQTGDKYS
jgi:hypothetical protein